MLSLNSQQHWPLSIQTTSHHVKTFGSLCKKKTIQLLLEQNQKLRCFSESSADVSSITGFLEIPVHLWRSCDSRTLHERLLNWGESSTKQPEDVKTHFSIASIYWGNAEVSQNPVWWEMWSESLTWLAFGQSHTHSHLFIHLSVCVGKNK